VNFRHFLLAALALATPLAAGCAVEPQSEEADETTADEAELTAAGRALQGSFEEKGIGDIRGLVLSTERATASKNRFFAVVRTGIVCVMAPCPTEARVQGTWSATKRVLTLTPDSCPPNALCAPQPFAEKAAADKLRGKYSYDLIKTGDFDAKLHLSPLPKAGGTIAAINIPGSLEKVFSYCTAEGDANDECRVQGLPEPLCAMQPGAFPHPHWTCNAQSRCSFSCGPIVHPTKCEGLTESQCDSAPGCRSVHGPSHCSPPPNAICTKDFVFKGCASAQ
jgi:hypothetical protein